MLRYQCILTLFFICIIAPGLADEGNEDETVVLMKKITSSVCSTPNATILNQLCFVAVIRNYFARFTFCNSLYSACFICQNVDSLGQNLFSTHNTNGQINMSDMEKVSVSLMTLTHDVREFCTTHGGAVPNHNYNYYWTKMSTEASFKKNKDTWLTQVFQHIAKQFNTTTNAKCITSKAIIEESKGATKKTNMEWAKVTSLFSILHVLNGFQLDGVCVSLPTQAALYQSLYTSLGLSSPSGRIPEKGIKDIMTKLGIGNSTAAATTTAGDPHGGHNHRRKRSAEIHSRVRRAVIFSSTSFNQCLTVDNLFAIYGINETAGVSLTQLKDLCPAFLQQKFTNVCAAKAAVATKVSALQAYGFGTLTVLIVSFGSLLGVVFIPCIKAESFKIIMLFAVSMAVGTLLCDSFLHLIPEALQLHGHQHLHTKTFTPPEPYFWKMFALVCLIYLWFLIELILSYWFSNMGHSHGGHKHGHSRGEAYVKDVGEHNFNGASTTLDTVPKNRVSADNNAVQNHEMGFQDPAPLNDDGLVKYSLSTAVFIIGGDAIHNFADGLAIGAAFSSSLSGGLATSIAIFCHELPHELGDFAVLLSSNVKVKKALLLNFVSALTAFIGFYIGVPIGENKVARHWIFIATSSIFLYISLSNIMSAGKKSCPGSKWASFAAQACGFLVGIIIITLIGVFESMIHV